MASGLVGYQARGRIFLSTHQASSRRCMSTPATSVRRGQRLATLRQHQRWQQSPTKPHSRAPTPSVIWRARKSFTSAVLSAKRGLKMRVSLSSRARDSSVLTAPADGISAASTRRCHRNPSPLAHADVCVRRNGRLALLCARRSLLRRSCPFAQLATPSLVRIATELLAAPRVQAVLRASPVKAMQALARSKQKSKSPDGDPVCAAAWLARFGNRCRAGRRPLPRQATDLVPSLSLLDARADQGIVFVIDSRRRCTPPLSAHRGRYAEWRPDCRGLRRRRACCLSRVRSLCTRRRARPHRFGELSATHAGDHALLRRSLAVHRAFCLLLLIALGIGAIVSDSKIRRPDHRISRRRHRGRAAGR